MKITKTIKKEQIFSLAVVCLLVIIFSISTASAATEVYVSNTGVDGDGYGTAVSPYLTIGYGIQKVDTEGTVNIAAGTYTGTGNKGITVNKNVTIIGAGKDSTIIDAEGSGKVFTIESYSFVTIKNLTIQNAKNDASVGNNTDLGGAIYNKGNLDVENTKFIGNHGHKGSGIANEGILTVKNCTFSGGVDNEWGGAIMNMGSLTVTDSIFTSNSAAYEGGAIFNHYDATITGSTFENNNAGLKGGAIFSVSMLFESILIGNNNRFIGNKILNADPSFFLPDITGIQPNDVYLAAHDEYPFNATMDISKNWWGQSTGPNLGQYFMYGTKGKITYIPWLTDPNGSADTTLPTVTAAPKGGTYSSAQNVVLTPSETASIYYTTDGSEPTKSSNLYSGPISISTSKTLKFKAWDSAGNPSNIYTETYTISSATKADLSVETVITNGNTATGITNYPVSSTVKNNGGANTNTFYVSYYLSTDQYKSSDDRYIGHATVNGLASGASTSAAINSNIPKDIAQGNYYIIAVADSTGIVSETNEANNVKSSASKIFVWKPELSVQTVTQPGNTAAGITNYSVSSTVKNSGSITSDKFYVSYYLSTDATKSSNDRYIGHATVDGLNGWSTTTATAKCTIPKDIAQGNYYIIAVADSTGIVSETNEANNAKSSASKIFVWKPDLTVETITTGGDTTKGASGYSVSSTVKNGGSITSDTFYVSYYLSTDQYKSSKDVYIGHATVNGLNGWTSTTVSANCNIPANIAAGNYYIIAVADVTGAVSESNGANNVKTSVAKIKIS